MEQTAKPKLTKTIMNGFGAADAGFQFCSNMELVYFAKFLSDACKFSPALVGTILMITSIVDMAWVFVAGAIVEKSNYKWMKWGKHRSWMIVGPPITYVTLICMFLFVPGAMAPYIIIFGFLASHLIWNVVYTAHITLINVMTDDPYERSRLSSSRQTWASAARIIFGYVAINTIQFGGATTSDTRGYTLSIMLWPLLMIAGYYYVFFITKGHDIEATAASKNKVEKVPVSMLLSETFKNTQLLILIVADIFRCLAYYLITGTAIYYFGKIFGNMSNWALYLVLLNFISFIGTIIAVPAAKKLGKKQAYAIGVFTYAVVLVFINIFASTDWFFIISMCVGTLVLQFSFCMITAMFADTATFGEWKTGKNIRAFIMGLLSFPIKASIFMRSAIIGGVLAAMNYTPDVAATAQEISGLKMMVTIIPAASALLSGLVIVFFYKLTDQRLVELSTEINQRKANATKTAGA